MSLDIHPLLRRQLKRIGVAPEAVGVQDAAWAELLQRVSRAYDDHDQERYLLERSQSLVSQEMSELNTALRAERDLLDERVRERTAALRVSEGRLASLLSLSADWIWEQDEQLRFTYMSEGVEERTGLPAASFIGQRRGAWNGFTAGAEAIADLESRLATHQPFRDFGYRITRPDGRPCHILISGEPVWSAEGVFKGYRGVGRDVTQAAVAELKVQEMARMDSLTGLPNRSLFLAELDRAILRAQRHGTRFAVCFMDLDRFKVVNDTLGHAAGDELLKTMAARLSATVRASDLLARLGGDEFVLLLEESGQPDTLHATAQRLLHAIGQPLHIQGHTYLVTGSVGISLYPDHARDAATLLRQADAAMYLAKSKGKNNAQLYTVELAESAARQFELETALRLGLHCNELLLHYQPKVCVASGRMLGVEALVRWCHPVRGMVGPDEFIPVAEERGLIVAIGRWVMQAACRQVRAWRDAGLQVLPVAVNLSARQFASDALLPDLEQALRQHGVGAQDIAVELTESVLMADPERASAVLQHLHAMGVSIAIDDFGTGYSSLSYLKRFPAHTVKIDRSFIRGLPVDANDLAIVRAVIAMAHTLGLKVVAEGVETEAQFSALRELGCDEAQGYLLGAPMSADALAKRLCLGLPVAA
jgi:diguanylate cyclase (GGDEF)-like protein/PAS domain S-box-containing protein